MYKLSVLMPVFNEKNHLKQIVDKVLSIPINKELIIVDDMSTDGTREILETFKSLSEVKIIYNDKNMGKGYSITKAISHATGDVIIFQDADLEYDPNDYFKIIKPIVDGKAEVVYGSRYSGSTRKVETTLHVFGNWFLTRLSNIFSGIFLSDMETCYKAFRRELIQNMIIKSNRFGIEPEITAKIAKLNGLNFFEVPITYNARWYDEGKKIGFMDGVRAIGCIIYFNLFVSPQNSFKINRKEMLEKIRTNSLYPDTKEKLAVNA